MIHEQIKAEKSSVGKKKSKVKVSSTTDVGDYTLPDNIGAEIILCR